MTTEVQIVENVILIRPSKLFSESMTDEELYEATRGVWKLGERRNEADFVFTVHGGVIKEAYKIGAWLPAGSLHYNSRSRKDVDVEDRWEFYGVRADESLRARYIGSSVKRYFPQGAANPAIYVNC